MNNDTPCSDDAAPSSAIIGKNFSSHEDLQRFVRELEEQYFLQLYVSHSRTIGGARRLGYRRYVNPELKYTEILYRCIHGGAMHSKSKGIRPGQSTYRQDCPFFFRLRAEGDLLVVVSSKEEHNHPQDKVTNLFLPRHRLSEEPSKFAKQRLSLKAYKKELQVQLQTNLNKNDILKDLHNLASSSECDDSLNGALNNFLEKEDAAVEIIKNSDNVLLGIFFQDTEMKRLFDRYPEVLFVDTIPFLDLTSDQQMLLYILLVQDGNGDSEIVSFYLVTDEDKSTIKQLPVLLKKHNPAWEKVQSIMTDKDFVERNVFKDEFPNANLLICIFHALQTFKREISNEKMSITPGDRNRCLKLLQDLAYSGSEAEYDALLQDLYDTKLKPAISYYKNNWHDIRNEWVLGFQQSSSITFGNRANKGLENIISKVNHVVKRSSKLKELIENLDNFLIHLRSERNSRAAMMQLRVPIAAGPCKSEKTYLRILTPYAYGIVKENFSHKDKVKIIDQSTDCTFYVQSNLGMLCVTPEKCDCTCFKSMQLPCSHILRIRELKHMNLFCDKLFSVRWTKKYYLCNSSDLEDCATATSETISSKELQIKRELSEDEKYKLVSAKFQKIAPKVQKIAPFVSEAPSEETKSELSQHEKYKLVLTKVQKIASFASEAPSELFSSRLEILNSIIDIWGRGCEVSVKEIRLNDDSNTHDEMIAKNKLIILKSGKGRKKMDSML